MRNWILSTLLVAGAVACASKEKIDVTKPLSGATASDAAKAYNRGMQEMKDKNYLEATAFLESVKSNFPYSQFAPLAELALADMNFERDDYAAAATAYQDFVKAHPSHPKADYAAFRVGLANYEDRASDIVFLPPSSERDQAPLRGALESLQKFVTAYPKSEYVVRARDLVADCRKRLADHDRYVAGFYWKRKAWRGAAGRLVALADTYGDLEGGQLHSDSLWRAAVAWQLAGDEASQRAILNRLLQETPASDPHHQYAEAELKSLGPSKQP
jgi:outer membrane protein assembly factor BamD